MKKIFLFGLFLFLIFNMSTGVFASCGGIPCDEADCNKDGVCDIDEDCMSCPDCLPLAPGGCECCNPWNVVDTDPNTRCMTHTVVHPCPGGLETCFHPDYLCVAPKSCQKILTVFPWLNCSAAVCGDHNCDPGENCASCGPPLWDDCTCADCDPTDPAADAYGCVFPVATGTTLTSTIKAANFGEFIENIINFIFYFGLAFVPILFIIAGFYFTTAGGDSSKITTAKNIAGWAVAGMLIILFAKGIIEVIKSILEVA